MKPFSSLAFLITVQLSLGLHAALAAPFTKSDPSGDELSRAMRDHERQASGSGFEENKGQVVNSAGQPATQVRYRLHRADANIFLLASGVAFQFTKTQYPANYHAVMGRTAEGTGTPEEMDAVMDEVLTETYRMDMWLEGADPNNRVSTTARSNDHVNYVGHGAMDVHSYGTVTYHDVYPGIDWVLYTTAQGIKYDFVVKPGSDPDRIRLRFDHHEELYVDANGELVHGNRMGRFVERRPVSYQGTAEIPTHYLLEGNTLRFAVGAYDRNATLTIDPDRVWSTYYGGTESDWGGSCATDASANVFLAGHGESANGIADGGYQVTLGGNDDAFLAKFNSDGVRLWATYLGGTGNDTGLSCVVSSTGAIYLSGHTTSSTGIASGGHQNTYGGARDGFLTKFDASGALLWSTYYGGVGIEWASSSAVDSDGNVYLAGITRSSFSIASGGHQNTFGGGDQDAFLVKFNDAGERLWATYYGGNDSDDGYFCGVDAIGNVYLAGRTGSFSSIASGGHQNNNGGGDYDAMLVKFNSAGVRQWATYYGGGGLDTGRACAVEANGNVVMVGWSNSTAGIAANGHQNSYGGGSNDGFLVKFSTSGQRLWGTYYGGESVDQIWGCDMDGAGNVCVAGWTGSEVGIADQGYQDVIDENGDAFLVKFSGTGTRQWGTYYGSGDYDEGFACALEDDGTVYLAGTSRSPSGIAAGGHQLEHGGDYDAMFVKFNGDASVGIEVLDGNAPANAWLDATGTVLNFSRPVDGSIIDMHGRTVRSVARGVPVAVHDLSPGAYLFRCKDGAVTRFVKE